MKNLKNETLNMKQPGDAIADLLPSQKIIDYFQISKSTLSRWVNRGCPHMKQPDSEHRFLFDLNRVQNWLKKESGLSTGNATRPQARHTLKLYHVFNGSGMYEGIVYGSRMLIQRLRSFDLCHRHYPYGADMDGYSYIYYSGRLRKLDSVKSAVVLICESGPPEVNALVGLLYRRYIRKII